jgi:hypothetical protein
MIFPDLFSKSTWWSFVIFLIWVVLCISQAAIADDQETTRENIKRQLKHIAKGHWDTRHKMSSKWGVIEGNIQRGNWAAWSDSDGNRAAKRAEANCEKNGGGCERLYTLYIHNDTPKTIRIYLFHPWESDFSKNNALFSWAWEPGQGRNLGLEGAWLVVSKRFYLVVESEGSGGSGWGRKRIDEFNYNYRQYREHQNIRINLVN